jgi:hypothetical protein
METTIQSFDSLMKTFGVVTVMEACIYKLKSEYSYTGRGSCQHGGVAGGALTREMFECTGLYLDTLKIANINQEGPTKEIKGGQHANTLIKYGKTTTMEMQDALGRAAVLETFFGCDVTRDAEGRVVAVAITDTFPGPIAIEGKTFFIDQKTGAQVEAYVFIPQFLPDAVLNLTQDAEGDAAVFDLNGAVSSTRVMRYADVDSAPEGQTPDHALFYELRRTPWFGDGTEEAHTDPADPGYHDVALQDAPEVTQNTPGVITWTEVDGADKYQYEITSEDGDVAGTTKGLTKSISAGESIRVRALGQSGLAITAYSEFVEYSGV